MVLIEAARQPKNQRQPNFTRPPPNLENTSIITELHKVGFKTNQEGRQDQELRTQMEIIKNLRETHIKREQELNSELQAYFNTKIENLERAVSKQKQANEEANSRALMIINLQQEELKIMQREQDIMKQEEEKQQHDLQEIIKTMRNYKLYCKTEMNK